MIPVSVQLGEEQTLAEAAMLLTKNNLRGAPVLSERGMLQGVLTRTDIEHVPSGEQSQRRVGEAMNQKVLVIHADDTLDEALEELTTDHVSWAPVVEVKALAQDRRVIGIISIARIVQYYRETLVKDSHRVQELVEGTAIER